MLRARAVIVGVGVAGATPAGKRAWPFDGDGPRLLGTDA